jgi:hypothetical protein
MTLLHTPTRLTAVEAQLAAEEFIQDHIGDQVLAGEPWPVHSTLSSSWVVPLILTRSAYGPVGAIGVLVVDEMTGQIIAATPTESLAETSRRLLAEQATPLEAAFHKLVAEGQAPH